MDKAAYNAIQSAVSTLINAGARRATKYLSDKLTVNVSRPVYKTKWRKGEDITLVVKIGRPNYEQREFIKQCKKAGESFPVRKMQLRFPPQK